MKSLFYILLKEPIVNEKFENLGFTLIATTKKKYLSVWFKLLDFQLINVNKCL